MKLINIFIFLLTPFFVYGQLLNNTEFSTVVKSHDHKHYTLGFNDEFISIYRNGIKKLNLKPKSKYSFTAAIGDSILFTDTIQIPKKDILYISFEFDDTTYVFYETKEERDLRIAQEKQQQIDNIYNHLILVPSGQLLTEDTTLINSFYICKYEVTQSLWEAVMDKRSGYYVGQQRPVESVSYIKVLEFITKLNTLSGRNYRLPTSNEWEYAAKGGPIQPDSIYAQNLLPEEIGWFHHNCTTPTNPKGSTHVVGSKLPNSLGLYDMNGNVWEWCAGATENKSQTIRGGSIATSTSYSTNNYKNSYHADVGTSFIGFRIAIDTK